MSEISAIIARQSLRELQAVYTGNFCLQLDRSENRTAKFASANGPLYRNLGFLLIANTKCVQQLPPFGSK